MSDQPMSPFVPVHPPLQPQPESERPKRRSGGKKKPASGRTRKPAAAPVAVAAPIPAPKKPRKPRVAKTDKAVVKRVLDIGAIVSATAGLKPDDARVLVKIYAMLSEHSAKSRAAIASSLAKLLG